MANVDSKGFYTSQVGLPDYVPPNATTPIDGWNSGASASSSMSAVLQQKLGALEDAINSGNQKQYDLALGELMGVFNGQPTLAAEKELGMIGGKPTLNYDTLAGVMPNGQPTEAGREFDLTTGKDLLSTAAGLTGPKDYGDFMKYTGDGQSLLQQVMGGRAQSSAPTQTLQPMDMNALMQKLGMGPGQGGAGQATGGVGGGGTDPAAPDYSMFPQNANAGDISYAMSGHAYDPTDYQNYMTSNGFTPSWQAGTTTTTPATSGQSGPLDTVWGPYDPTAQEGSKTDNAALRRLVLNQYMGTGGGPGSGQTMYNGQNTDAISDPEIASLVSDFMGKRAGSAGSTTSTASTEPSWFKDYMTTLSGLGPNLNAGVAENLPMLSQLGMANPQGLQTLLNPNGNVDPAYWDSIGPVGQQLMAQAASKVFGWDPTEFVRQINAQRPLGSAEPPSTTQIAYAPLAA